MCDVHCSSCGQWYEDAGRWTLCPHPARPPRVNLAATLHELLQILEPEPLDLMRRVMEGPRAVRGARETPA